MPLAPTPVLCSPLPPPPPPPTVLQTGLLFGSETEKDTHNMQRAVPCTVHTSTETCRQGQAIQ